MCKSVGLVPNQGHDHRVEVEEEHDEVESELDERFLRVNVSLHSRREYCPSNAIQGMFAYLLVYIQLPENLSSVKEMCVVKNPIYLISSEYRAVKQPDFVCEEMWNIQKASQPGVVTYFLTLKARSGRLRINATQYPLIRNSRVKKPWTAASGMI